jgi:hypothetical protein
MIFYLLWYQERESGQVLALRLFGLGVVDTKAPYYRKPRIAM